MPRRPVPTSRRRVLLPLLLAALAGACRTPAEHRAAADEEVYEIVRRRRAELGAEGAFTIEPPEDGLRARILAASRVEGPVVLEDLRLVDCLEIASEESREYRRRRELLYLTALDLTLERWRYGWQEELAAGASVDGTGREAGSAAVGADLGLARLFGTGALVVGNLGLDLARALSTGDPWEAVSSGTLTITQPLLRGFGARVVTEPLTQAERNVLYEARAYERFRHTFAFDVAERFFRILEQEATLANEELNYDSLIEIRERNEALAEAGRLIDIEVDQARQDELRARNRVVDAERRLQGLLDDFKLFLGLPVDVVLDLEEAPPGDLGPLGIPAVEPDEERLVAVAIAQRLDHRTTVDRVADAERDVVVAADDLRPGLDVALAVSTASDEGQPLDLDGDQTPWSASVVLDLPIDRLPERNAYRAALVDLQAAARDLEESRDAIVADVREALRALAASREGLAIQENAVELADRRVESARLNLEAGRADTRDVLEAQEALVQARNALVRARFDVLLAGLALFRDTELLRVDEEGLRVETDPLEQVVLP